VYCLENNDMTRDQILMRGRDLYLCAPKGQMIEGYLAICPYSCVGAFSRLPTEYFAELSRLKSVVAEFYRRAYQFDEPTMYEQGRGGGGASASESAGFPFHAHLCFLPAKVDLHAILTSKYLAITVHGVEELPAVAKGRPYVYAEAADCSGSFRRAVYLASSKDLDPQLEQERLKPAIAEALNMSERGDWRLYPGDAELARLLERFTAFRAQSPYPGGRSDVRVA
jgi:diadenosine tetraphosphate (Ap4A) HIT family hydrolase